MGEMTINQIIKIILGILVAVAVIVGVSILFKDNIIEFFRSWGGETTTLVLSLI